MSQVFPLYSWQWKLWCSNYGQTCNTLHKRCLHHSDAWRTVLEKNYGQAISLPTKYGTSPVQYKSEGVSITVWKKEKQSKSTILIQGRENYLNFASKQLPRLFKEVKEHLQSTIGLDILDHSRKRKIDIKPDFTLCGTVWNHYKHYLHITYWRGM